MKGEKKETLKKLKYLMEKVQYVMVDEEYYTLKRKEIFPITIKKDINRKTYKGIGRPRGNDYIIYKGIIST